MFNGKTYWIIGASEGLGRALTYELSAAGVSLVLSARSAERLDSLAADLPNARSIPMDVCSQLEVEAASKEADEIDGIIYCAGDYDPMSAMTWNSEKAVQLADINFMGALRVLGLVMPKFAKRNAGHVVLIGSLAGYRGLPDAIGYGASKAGLMHLAENIRADTRGTPIKVQVVNPGFIKTRLTAKNDFSMPSILEPEEAAKIVFKAMKSSKFSTSFPAPFSWIFTLGRFVPLGFFQRIFQS